MTERSVHLRGPGPYGFRLFGGITDPLRIAKVRKDSKADEAGVRVGDEVLSINGHKASELTPASAMGIVDNSGNFIDMRIQRSQTNTNSSGYSYPTMDSYSTNSLSSTYATANRYPQDASESSLDALDMFSFDEFVTKPVDGRSDYSRHEESTVDGNTSKRTTTEKERIGGTTLTKVTNESYTNWNDYDHSPAVRSSPREPFFRTTSAGIPPADTPIPTNRKRVQMTFDLGQSLTGDIHNKEFSLSSSDNDRNTFSPPDRFNSSSFSTKSSNIWKPAPSTLPISIDFHSQSDYSTSFSDPPKMSQLGSNRRSVWTPSKHEEPPRTRDIGLPLVNEPFEFAIPFPQLNEKNKSVHTIAKHAPFPQAWTAEDTLLNETKENFVPSFPDQSSFGKNSNQWNSSASDIFPLDIDFDLTKPGNTNLSQSHSSRRNDAIWKPSTLPTTSRNDQKTNDPISPDSSLFPRRGSKSKISKFDSDLDYVDLLSLDDLKTTKGSQSSTNQLPFPELPPSINKIISEPPESTISNVEVPAKRKQKVFSDSSFYVDSKHHYPTVEEQVKMARIVAHSLTSDANASARGHQMFLKRKERADAFIVDSAANEKPVTKISNLDNDLHYNPAPWNAAKNWTPSTTAGVQNDFVIPPPPPLPSSLLFAPRGEGKSKGLSAEEFERVRLYDQKTKHNVVSPQVCFNLAKDLRENKGRGGKMFAKRRARADQWVVEGEGKGPDPSVMMKISSGFSQEPNQSRSLQSSEDQKVNKQNAIDYSLGPPVNRLKEMIDLPKPRMTPWDAVVEYGDVGLAFEHLKDYQFFSDNPGSASQLESLSNSLRHRTGVKPLGDRNNSFVPKGSDAQSWTLPSVTGNASDFSMNNKFSQQFTPMTDFSTKSSSSSYKPVSYSGSNYNQTFSVGGSSSVY